MLNELDSVCAGAMASTAEQHALGDHVQEELRYLGTVEQHIDRVLSKPRVRKGLSFACELV